MNKPTHFAIWGNTEKDSLWTLIPDILEWSESKNLQVTLTERIVKDSPTQLTGEYQIMRQADEFKAADFVLALGGDGTFLSAVRAIGHRQVPVLGIHLGDLGFLAKVTREDLFPRLDLVAEGQYEIEERLVLRGMVETNGAQDEFMALNDVVVEHAKPHRMISSQLQADGRFVGNYLADGIIVATPTGSTAYSLSAGGPIVKPGVDTMIITPICPHTLTSRPLVVPASMTLEITFPSSQKDPIDISVDGQIASELDADSRVVIQKAPYSASLITFEDANYFQTLRTKMGWGQRGNQGK